MLDPELHRRCPVDAAIDVVGGKWKPLIIHRLSGGPLRFNQLQRSMPGVTQRMLTLQLRELERDGLVLRTVFLQVPLKVEYRLTAPALRLLPLLGALGEWLIEQHAELRRIGAASRDAGAAPAVDQRVPAGRG